MKLNEIKIPSTFFEMEQGKNKFRLVSDFAQTEDVFEREDGTKSTSIKWCCWVIDRVSGEFKFAKFGKSIVKQFQALVTSEDYGFDTVPSYDMTITKEGSGLKTTYAVMPDRNDTLLTDEEKAGIEKLVPPSKFLEKISKPKATSEELTPEDLPF